MFQIIFRPKPDWQEKVTELESGKKLLELFLICVTKAFNGTVKSGKSGSLENDPCAILVTIHGVTPMGDEATRAVLQIIASQLVLYKLNNIFSISEVKTIPTEQDNFFDPRFILQTHYPKTMFDAFKIEPSAIPNRFICPISQEIMSQPVYLITNPAIHYERMDLLKWISKNNTDPTTRAQISEIGLIDDNDVRTEIYSFVFDLISGNNVAHYFRAEDGDKVGTALTKTTSVTATTGPTLFAVSDTDSKNSDRVGTRLVSVFSTLRLDDEFLNLAAKGLRRAAFCGKQNEVEQLIRECGNAIIDIQDSNSEKQFTALHLALNEKKYHVAKYLLQQGAQIDISNVEGTTARNLITASEDPEIKELRSFFDAATIDLAAESKMIGSDLH